MSTKTYDYLFKLLLIGDSGKWSWKAENSIAKFHEFVDTILDIWNFFLLFLCVCCFSSLCRRNRSWKDLHSVQIQREQLQHDIYINHWWVGRIVGRRKRSSFWMIHEKREIHGKKRILFKEWWWWIKRHRSLDWLARDVYEGLKSTTRDD